MAMVNVNFQVDNERLAGFRSLCAEQGMNISEAIGILMDNALFRGTIPVDMPDDSDEPREIPYVKAYEPTLEGIERMHREILEEDEDLKELQDIISGKKPWKRYSSAQEMIDSLETETPEEAAARKLTPDLIRAMQECRDIMSGKIKVKSYSSAHEMVEDLLAEDNDRLLN